MNRFLVVVAPEMSGLTPDDLVIVPADTKGEVEALWDLHDGRNLGTMVVGVYKLDERAETPAWVRDESWGILGNVRKTGPAAEDDTF